MTARPPTTAELFRQAAKLERDSREHLARAELLLQHIRERTALRAGRSRPCTK